MWANDIEMTKEEKMHIWLLRRAGCTCKLPLLGFIPDQGPRCRMCGVEAKLGYGACPDCRWYGIKSGCNVSRDSDQCRLNKGERKE